MQTLPPYAVPTVEFPLRALAAHVSRQPIGGPREVALVTFLAARLVRDSCDPRETPVLSRRTRANAARSWIGPLNVAPSVRGAFLRLVQSYEDAASHQIREAMTELIASAGPGLDSSARIELKRLLSLVEAPK